MLGADRAEAQRDSEAKGMHGWPPWRWDTRLFRPIYRHSGRRTLIGRHEEDRSGSRLFHNRVRGLAEAPNQYPARANTSSSIASVNRPVKVFCWLGW